MAVEIIEDAGTRYAEVIRADTTVDRTTFFSPPESSFQFGLPSYAAGYCETPHYHQPFVRQVDDLQQMFVVQRGIGGVSLYDDLGLVASRHDGATLRRPNASQVCSRQRTVSRCGSRTGRLPVSTALPDLAGTPDCWGFCDNRAMSHSVDAAQESPYITRGASQNRLHPAEIGA